MKYVIVYLVSIVAANLSILWFGPSVAPVTAFVLIALDLTLRDLLHDYWENNRLILKMSGLIIGGSAITVVLNYEAMQIAIASATAFFAAGIADTLVYKSIRNKQFLIRSNGSNVVSAAVDSLVFPVMAFGYPPLWPIIAAQFFAKTIGGFIWSIILKKYWITNE